MSQELIEKLGKRALGPLLIATEAEADGADIDWISKYMFIAKKGSVIVPFHDVRAVDTTVAATMSGRKHLTRKLMRMAKVPIPKGKLVKTESAAIEFWKELGQPVVVKPKKGTKGIGITVGVDSEDDMRAALKRAKLSRDSVLIEQMVKGVEYRVIVVGTKALGVLAKDAANVIGDGALNIEQLVEGKNITRSSNPHLCTRLIKLNDYVLSNLEKQGVDVTYIPKNNEKVYLRREANFSAGGDTVDITDSVPEKVLKISENAVRAIPGLEIAGVDIFYDEQTGDVNIIEVNTDPGIGGHHFPMVGTPRNIAREIWLHAYKILKTRIEHSG